MAFRLITRMTTSRFWDSWSSLPPPPTCRELPKALANGPMSAGGYSSEAVFYSRRAAPGPYGKLCGAARCPRLPAPARHPRRWCHETRRAFESRCPPVDAVTPGPGTWHPKPQRWGTGAAPAPRPETTPGTELQLRPSPSGPPSAPGSDPPRAARDPAPPPAAQVSGAPRGAANGAVRPPSPANGSALGGGPMEMCLVGSQWGAAGPRAALYQLPGPAVAAAARSRVARILPRPRAAWPGWAAAPPPSGAVRTPWCGRCPSRCAGRRCAARRAPRWTSLARSGSISCTWACYGASWGCRCWSCRLTRASPTASSWRTRP